MDTREVADLFGEGGVPPAKLKIFAPNGTTMESEGWLGVRPPSPPSFHRELHLIHPDGTSEPLNRKVVILNVELGLVVYNPRNPGPMLGPTFLSARERLWLDGHPAWPEILELVDKPVENGDDNEGIEG